MCRLCLPNTTLEQHFKYFSESGFKGANIVELVLKFHSKPNPGFIREVEITSHRDHVIMKPVEYIKGEFREVPKALEEPKED